MSRSSAIALAAKKSDLVILRSLQRLTNTGVFAFSNVNTGLVTAITGFIIMLYEPQIVATVISNQNQLRKAIE